MQNFETIVTTSHAFAFNTSPLYLIQQSFDLTKNTLKYKLFMNLRLRIIS